MNRQMIKQVLRENGLAPSKKHGQNFLFDHAVVTQLLDFADLNEDEAVVEIGPGLGALSAGIMERSNRSLFVEIDSGFCKVLTRTYPVLKAEKRLLEADVLQLQAKELAERLDAARIVVVSNAPYSISSEIILWVLRNRKYISRACLFLQREFAERIAAEPGSKSYGSLSVLRNLYAEVRSGPLVSGDRFYPKAQVESRAICLEIRGKPLIADLDEKLFEEVVRASFAKRRKTLLNSLSHSPLFEDKEIVRDLLTVVGIDPGRRAETLSVAEFAKITESVEQMRSAR